MDNPLVSIIIPTYNYGTLIAQTLQCILQQSYANWEIIIVDDGSLDNTKVIVEEFIHDSRFSYIFQENKGLPAARNTGISKARGKYIQLLDADDLISKEKLRLQVQYMENNLNVHISYTNAFYFKYDNVNQIFANRRMTQTPWIPKLHGEGINIVQNLVFRNIMPVNAALIRKDVFGVVGQQNEDLKSLEDWEFWMRCALANVFFSYVENKDAFALIRLHHSSMSLNKLRMIDQELVFREKIASFITGNTFLREDDKDKLRSINENKKIDTYRKLLITSGFFNKKTVQEIYSKYGLFTLLKVYIKALNDLRRQKGNF